MKGKIVPPRDGQPHLLYLGLWSRVEQFEFNAADWSGFEVTPADDEGPYLFYGGTFYSAGLSDAAKARLREPFMELAGAIGRDMANKDFEEELRKRQRPETP